MILIVFSILFLASIFEGTILHLPITLIALLFSTIFLQKNYIFYLSILIGIFLDFLTFSQLGFHDLFFLIFLGIIFIYLKKFEVKSLQFALTMTVLGSLGYGLFFGNQNLILQVLVSLILSLILFLIGKFILESSIKQYKISL